MSNLYVYIKLHPDYSTVNKTISGHPFGPNVNFKPIKDNIGIIFNSYGFKSDSSTIDNNLWYAKVDGTVDIATIYQLYNTLNTSMSGNMGKYIKNFKVLEVNSEHDMTKLFKGK